MWSMKPDKPPAFELVIMESNHPTSARALSPSPNCLAIVETIPSKSAIRTSFVETVDQCSQLILVHVLPQWSRNRAWYECSEKETETQSGEVPRFVGGEHGSSEKR
jgi:hypothetical protein